jgi:hypothetical protein
MLKKIFKKRIHEILEKFSERPILINDEMANFFGQESLGVWKIRGNGVLILTDEELFFEMWKPKKEISIPIKSIIEIKNPKSHMHRSVFRTLLKIIFKNENDEFDSAAWYVHNLDQWNKILNKLINKNQ